MLMLCLNAMHGAGSAIRPTLSALTRTLGRAGSAAFARISHIGTRCGRSSTVHVRDVESAAELLHRMDSCQVNSLVSANELICVILVTVSWRPHLWDERLEQFLDDLQEKWGFVRPGNDPRSSDFDDFVAKSCTVLAERVQQPADPDVSPDVEPDHQQNGWNCDSHAATDYLPRLSRPRGILLLSQRLVCCASRVT